MNISFWVITGTIVVLGALAIVALLRLAAGRRPDGSTETILQVDAENRAVFGRTDHEEWDGEVRITRPTDPRIVRQVQKLRRRQSD
jgi:predicted RecA/RadA family phage recombinase